MFVRVEGTWDIGDSSPQSHGGPNFISHLDLYKGVGAVLWGLLQL